MTNLQDVRCYEFSTIEKYFSHGIRALEIGGGNGYQASLLAASGVDIKSIDVVKLEGEQNFFHVEIYDGHTIPFSDATFDVVFSSNVLEHVQDINGMMAEIRRVLKMDGVTIHILPTPVWRFWTSLTHYAYLTVRILGIQRPVGGGNVVPSLVEKMVRSGLLATVKRILMAGPHGEYKSAVSELWYFGKIRWRAVFQSNAFNVASSSPSGIFYTGYIIAPSLPISRRQKLSKILGSSTCIYVLQKTDSSKRIIILVRRLDQGGAQRQLISLALGLKASGYDVHVVLFYPGGAFEAELSGRGVPIHVPGKHGRWDTVGFLIRLAICLRNLNPDVIYSFMNVSNILAVLLKPLLARARIVWGVRASNIDFSHYDWLSRLTYALECRLANFADKIIANSNAGKLHSVANGFPEDKIVVIPNGIDTDYFRPDSEGRRRVRAEWALGEHEILVGLVGRLDPMKDHTTFLEAASRIARRRHDVHFVCVGDGPAAFTEFLKQQAATLGLTSRLIWAGARDDLPAVYSALDVACSSSSFGEGFSNTIAEAMACGVPCVVTDVGDSALIVGGTASVVAPADHSVFAAAIERLADLPGEERRMMGAACRTRVVSEFGIDRLIQRTEQALGLV